jgi:hypothetical protein
VPNQLHLTVTGFVNCGCFDGSFVLTRVATMYGHDVWSSPAITGCPGQTDPAFLELASGVQVGSGVPAFGFGIAAAGSVPGSGNSDLAVPTSVTCSPFAARGGGSEAGNINAFCPGIEDEQMTWSITN